MPWWPAMTATAPMHCFVRQREAERARSCSRTQPLAQVHQPAGMSWPQRSPPRRRYVARHNALQTGMQAHVFEAAAACPDVEWQVVKQACAAARCCLLFVLPQGGLKAESCKHDIVVSKDLCDC